MLLNELYIDSINKGCRVKLLDGFDKERGVYYHIFCRARADANEDEAKW